VGRPGRTTPGRIRERTRNAEANPAARAADIEHQLAEPSKLHTVKGNADLISPLLVLGANQLQVIDRRMFEPESGGCTHMRDRERRGNMAQCPDAPLLSPGDALFRPCSRSMIGDRFQQNGGFDEFQAEPLTI
jgi:hypothetical protein